MTMDTLPPEVIRDIFLQVIEKNLDPHCLYYTGTYRTIPLSVSHVCRFWRDVTLSFGELWSYLSLCTSKYDPGQERPLELVETCIRRTNGCPLNFSISVSESFGRHSSSELREMELTIFRIIDLLITQQHRWGDVDFSWNCTHIPTDILKLWRLDNMPLLKSLRLFISLSDQALRPLIVAIDLAKSTRLRCFRLHGDFLLGFGEKPMHTLTGPCVISRKYNSSEMLMTLLKVAPNLEQLRLMLKGEIEAPSLEPRAKWQGVILHNLRSLRLTGNTMPFTNEDVSFPSLTALCLSRSPYGFTTVDRLFKHFMAHHNPSLTFLGLGDPINSQLLVTNLRLLPTLRDLRMTFADGRTLGDIVEALMLRDGDDKATSQLERSTGSGIICPLLHSFHFEIQADFSEYVKAMCDMLEMRRKALNTFQRIRLGLIDEIEMPLDPEDIGEITRLYSSGLQIHAEGDGVEPYPFEE